MVLNEKQYQKTLCWTCLAKILSDNILTYFYGTLSLSSISKTCENIFFYENCTKLVLDLRFADKNAKKKDCVLYLIHSGTVITECSCDTALDLRLIQEHHSVHTEQLNQAHPVCWLLGARSYDCSMFCIKKCKQLQS